MFDIKNLNKKKKPSFEFSGGAKKKVIQLEAYYKVGRRWHKVSDLAKKGGK
jgi:hypothetical protein